jgi:hypothetical protein
MGTGTGRACQVIKWHEGLGTATFRTGLKPVQGWQQSCVDHLSSEGGWGVPGWLGACIRKPLSTHTLHSAPTRVHPALQHTGLPLAIVTSTDPWPHVITCRAPSTLSSCACYTQSFHTY